MRTVRTLSGLVLLVMLTSCAFLEQDEPVTPASQAPFNTLPSGEPVPTPFGDTPSSPAPSMPVSWTDEEAIGVCKETWTRSGQILDWAGYTPTDAVVGADGSVSIELEPTSGETLGCDITGTPSAPVVTTRVE